MLHTEYLCTSCHLQDALSPPTPETHTKRQVTQQYCSPGLLGDGDKRIEIVYTVRKTYFVLGRLEQPRQDKNLLYPHDKPNEPTMEGSLSFLLFEFPFTSVSTVSRGHPSLVSLSNTLPPSSNVCLHGALLTILVTT